MGHVDDVLAVQGVVGDHAVDRFPHPQTVGIVSKGGGGRAVGHLLQLPALLPCVRPRAVAQGIANRVVGNGRAVVGGQLVLPVGIAVSIRDRLEHVAHAAGGVGIPLLRQNVPAPVVIIEPSRARAAGGSIIGVVDANQLAQIVVDVGSGHAVAGGGEYVAHVVIGIGAGFAVLGHGRDQGRGAAAAVAARQIAVGGGVGRAAHRDGAAAHPANGVVGVGDFVARIPEGHQGGLVLGIIGKIGLVGGSGRAHLLLEGLQVAVFVVPHLAGVEMIVALHVNDAHGPAFHVVFADGGAAQQVIRHLRHLAVSAVGVPVTILRIAVKAHAGQPFVVVVGIALPAAVAEVHARDRAVQGIAGSGIVHGLGQRLTAHLHRGGAVLGVVGEIVFHVAGVVRRGVVG